MEKFGCILQAPGGAGFLDVFFFFKAVFNGLFGTLVWELDEF